MSEVIEKGETGSTNDDAKRLAAGGAPHLTVVWAHRQVAGRGRHDRAWASPEGNLYWSVIVRPELGWPPVANLVYVNALAVLITLEAATGQRATGHGAGLTLKWPNDVLLEGRKVAGSLLESAGAQDKGGPPWVVMGTGINVSQHPDDPDMRYPATSLHREGHAAVRPEALAAALRTNVAAAIDSWLASGFPPVRDTYLRHAHALGETIRVGLTRDRREYLDGVYRGIDGDGALLLDRADGSTVTLHSGDVILRA
jgi:BirA family biotin operon repressor/biotin-[acetyl-CoA-carboxylase] ligase